MPYGVPHGSILGPVLFNLYMLPLGQTLKENVLYHSYGDTTQIYLALSPSDLDFMNLFNKVHNWMHQNVLLLNKDKIEIILNIKSKCPLKISPLKTKKSRLKNLGVIMEGDLEFSEDIKLILKSAFWHLKNIAKVPLSP